MMTAGAAASATCGKSSESRNRETVDTTFLRPPAKVNFIAACVTNWRETPRRRIANHGRNPDVQLSIFGSSDFVTTGVSGCGGVDVPPFAETPRREIGLFRARSPIFRRSQHVWHFPRN